MSLTIWDGTTPNPSGSTSFGYYDADEDFQADAPSIVKWCARRLGYPVMTVEMTIEQMYDCVEQAVLDYTEQINHFRIRENMSDLQGMSTSGSAAGVVGPNTVDFMIRLSEGYGAEVGAGGNIDWHRGHILTEPNKQVYDLPVSMSFADESHEGKIIEVKRVFHHETPASSKIYDPFAMTGMGQMNFLNQFGWGGMGMGVEHMLMPLHEDLIRMQAVEMNQAIRKSGFSFELINNKLRLFPRPLAAFKVWFDYILVEDRKGSNIAGGDIVTDHSNVPFDRIAYSKIKQAGRNWIKQYALAVMKMTLGEIRSKYGSVPIPDGDINLNGDTLKSEGQDEIRNAIDSLRETLEESSRARQIEKKQQETSALTDMLKTVPMKFYTG